MQKILMVQGAAKIIDECLCIKRGEKVVIVTDLNKIAIGEVIATVLHERGAEISLCVMTPRSRHSEDPPIPIGAAMEKADAIIMPTTFSLTHSMARRNANAKGARVLSLPGYTEAIMASQALNVDFQKLRPTVLNVAKLFDTANKAHLYSSKGTDLMISLDGKKGTYNTCIADQPGTWAAPPGLEATVAPVEDSTTGVVVVDGVLIPGGIVESEVKIEFFEGKIKSISGGRQADDFGRLLQSYDDPNVYYAVELGIGLNPNSKLGRNMIEDESTYGTVHIGLGEGRTFGSKISAKAHVDFVLDRPTLELDGKVIVSDRKLLLE